MECGGGHRSLETTRVVRVLTEPVNGFGTSSKPMGVLGGEFEGATGWGAVPNDSAKGCVLASGTEQQPSGDDRRLVRRGWI
jgi:hypothetical protein